MSQLNLKGLSSGKPSEETEQIALNVTLGKNSPCLCGTVYVKALLNDSLVNNPSNTCVNTTTKATATLRHKEAACHGPPLESESHRRHGLHVSHTQLFSDQYTRHRGKKQHLKETQEMSSVPALFYYGGCGYWEQWAN